MKKAIIFLILILTIAPVATINSRQSITRKDGEWERVKITVTLDDGTDHSYWPYIKKGSIADKDLQTQAIVAVQASAVVVEPVEMVPVTEINATLTKLKINGKIVYGTWTELKSEATSVRVTP